METENRDEKGRWLPGHAEPGPGRPKFSVLSIIKDELEKVRPGEREPLIRRMIRDYVEDATERKDGVAIRDIVDRFDGKPKQHVTVQNESDSAWLEYLKEVDAESEPEADSDIPTVPADATEDPDTGGRG